MDDQPRAEEVRTELAELWPDGKVRPVHPNHKPLFGQVVKPPPYAHLGTKWVRRTIAYSAWEEIDA